MREIVHLQAGQCGNQIGAKFWEVSCCKRREEGPSLLSYFLVPVDPRDACFHFYLWTKI
jgi:hypothetical protein